MSFLRYVTFAALFVGCASAKPDGDEAVRPVKEIVSGGARIRGGGVRMDVQVGRPFTQRTTRNANVIAKPAAVVTP